MKKLRFKMKIRWQYLLLALLIGASGFAATWLSRNLEPTAYADVQRAAAERMQRGEAVLLDVVLQEGIAIEDIDLNQTGLIGPEWTPLTTTPGIEEAKRTSLDPNFAALLVRYFKETGLEAGDRVAVGTSGSFPGLLMATLCAATELELDVDVIASFGSSMYGATRLELNVCRILRILRENGVIDYELLAVSPGGNNDYGESALWPDSRDTIAALAAEEGVEYIDYNDIEKSIARRLELFGEDVDCFVNVGGASANSGTSAYTLDFPNGLVTDPPRIPTTANRGLMYEYAARGIPVINMLNVRQMAADNGLPYDPVPLTQPGEGGVYYHIVYRVWIAALAVALMLAVLVLGRLRWSREQRTDA